MSNDFDIRFRDLRNVKRSPRTWNRVGARGGIVKVRGEHGGDIIDEESWRRNHGGGIMEETSLMRNNRGGIMEEESWRRNPP